MSDHRHESYDIYGLDGTGQDAREALALVGGLREDLAAAEARLRELEERLAALEKDTPQARQLQYEADVAAADLAESGYDDDPPVALTGTAPAASARIARTMSRSRRTMTLARRSMTRAACPSTGTRSRPRSRGDRQSAALAAAAADHRPGRDRGRTAVSRGPGRVQRAAIELMMANVKTSAGEVAQRARDRATLKPIVDGLSRAELVAARRALHKLASRQQATLSRSVDGELIATLTRQGEVDWEGWADQ
jgi:hypothetical protein